MTPLQHSCLYNVFLAAVFLSGYAYGMIMLDSFGNTTVWQVTDGHTKHVMQWTQNVEQYNYHK